MGGLAFSADGRYLGSSGRDRTVRVWDLERGTSIRVIRGHTDTVNQVAFSPDGDRLVTCSNDGTARVWDLTIDPETGANEFGSSGPRRRSRRSPMRGGTASCGASRASGRLYRHAAGSLVVLRSSLTDLPVNWHTPFEPAAFDCPGPAGRRGP